jgi:Holliday junction resolvase RusA-like endonuclease
MSASVTFAIPLLPPSLNHYTKHPAAGVHFKTKEAKGWEKAFPIFSRGQFVQSDSGLFEVTIRFTPGLGAKGDVDNYNKLPLDCCAKAGMFRDRKGNPVSDAWVKKLTIELFDAPEDRKHGPETRITIEPYERPSQSRQAALHHRRLPEPDPRGQRPPADGHVQRAV